MKQLGGELNQVPEVLYQSRSIEIQGNSPKENEEGLGKIFSDALSGVQDSLKQSEEASTLGLVGGKAPHEVMLALTKADLSFRFLAQARNKAIEAYKEVMRIQM